MNEWCHNYAWNFNFTSHSWSHCTNIDAWILILTVRLPITVWPTIMHAKAKDRRNEKKTFDNELQTFQAAVLIYFLSFLWQILKHYRSRMNSRRRNIFSFSILVLLPYVVQATFQWDHDNRPDCKELEEAGKCTADAVTFYQCPVACVANKQVSVNESWHEIELTLILSLEPWRLLCMLRWTCKLALYTPPVTLKKFAQKNPIKYTSINKFVTNRWKILSLLFYK